MQAYLHFFVCTLFFNDLFHIIIYYMYYYYCKFGNFRENFYFC